LSRADGEPFENIRSARDRGSGIDGLHHDAPAHGSNAHDRGECRDRQSSDVERGRGNVEPGCGNVESVCGNVEPGRDVVECCCHTDVLDEPSDAVWQRKRDHEDRARRLDLDGEQALRIRDRQLSRAL
jgi:hypothetical protein